MKELKNRLNNKEFFLSFLLILMPPRKKKAVVARENLRRQRKGLREGRDLHQHTPSLLKNTIRITRSQNINR